jgi:hypothetical protein
MLTRPLSLSFVFNIPHGSAITFPQNQKLANKKYVVNAEQKNGKMVSGNVSYTI